MTPPIFKLCSVAPAVTALLGSGQQLRLYSFGGAPQGVAKPYAVWQLLSGAPENYLSGRPDLDDLVVQVDVYGTTASSVRAVRDALRDAIELDADIVRWGPEMRDPETKHYRLSFDVSWPLTR